MLSLLPSLRAIRPVSLLQRSATFCSTAVSLANRGVPTASKLRSIKVNEFKAKKPKKPLNAYLLFCAERRPHVKEDNPQAKTTEITAMVGEEWRALSNEAKLPYQQEAQQRAEAHKIILSEFEKSLPPKKPAGPFVQFSHDIRAALNEEYPNLEFVEKAKITSARWNQLSEEIKEQYKRQYAERMAEWKATVDRM